jgi:hypothetical protein
MGVLLFGYARRWYAFANRQGFQTPFRKWSISTLDDHWLSRSWWKSSFDPFAGIANKNLSGVIHKSYMNYITMILS